MHRSEKVSQSKTDVLTTEPRRQSFVDWEDTLVLVFTHLTSS